MVDKEAPAWSVLRQVVVVSTVATLVSHAYGIAAWISSTDATLTRFDLSTIQSEVGNPSGYHVSLFGMVVAVLLIGYVAHAMRVRAAVPAALLLIAVALFLLNTLSTNVMPDVWRIHAILARISFVTLIASQIAFFARYRMRTDWLVAWGTLVAAIVLFILPKFFNIDLMMQIANFDVNIILGLSEVAYLAIFFTGMYRMLTVAERETNE